MVVHAAVGKPTEGKERGNGGRGGQEEEKRDAEEEIREGSYDRRSSIAKGAPPTWRSRLMDCILVFTRREKSILIFPETSRPSDSAAVVAAEDSRSSSPTSSLAGRHV